MRSTSLNPRSHHGTNGQPVARRGGRRGRRTRWLALLTSCACALALSGLAGSAANAAPSTMAAAKSQAVHRAAGIPLTGQKCTFGSSSGNVETCVHVLGHGRYIQEAWTTAFVFRAGRNLESILTGPLGPGGAQRVVSYSGFAWIPVNHYQVAAWNPYHNEPVGYYCGWTYRENAYTSTLIGKVCLYVHP